MRVLLYGEGEKIGSGAWCYAETLREMGHEVEVFSERRRLVRYQKSPLLRAYRRAAGQPLPGTVAALAAELMELVKSYRPAIVIVLKGLLLGSRVVQQMRRAGAWVTNINHDDFFSRNSNNRSHIQLAALSSYSYIFTTREVNVGEVRSFNPNVELFPFAYYPRIHRPVEIPASERARWRKDVTFVGTWERGRCKLLESLVRSVPAAYAIYGNQWEKISRASPLRRHVYFGELGPDEMAKAIGGARIALGFLRKENRDEYTQRTFEIPACGGFLLAERSARHLYWFKEGRDAEFFDPENPAELIAKVRLILGDEIKRKQIRANGRTAVLKGKHTYRDRLDRLFQVYAGERSV